MKCYEIENEILDMINDHLAKGNLKSHDVFHIFKDFIDGAIEFKTELEINQTDVQKLEQASISLEKLFKVKINED